MKMEQTECSETSAYKIQKPGNYPEGSIQHSEHGESLKSRRIVYLLVIEKNNKRRTVQRIKINKKILHDLRGTCCAQKLGGVTRKFYVALVI
jgi:hypothetical protein